MEVEAGQVWTLWVYDDTMRVTLKVEEVRDGNAWGVSEDGNDCVVGVDRLLNSGELQTDYQPRIPFERRT